MPIVKNDRWISIDQLERKLPGHESNSRVSIRINKEVIVERWFDGFHERISFPFSFSSSLFLPCRSSLFRHLWIQATGQYLSWWLFQYLCPFAFMLRGDFAVGLPGNDQWVDYSDFRAELFVHSVLWGLHVGYFSSGWWNVVDIRNKRYWKALILTILFGKIHGNNKEAKKHLECPMDQDKGKQLAINNLEQ